MTTTLRQRSVIFAGLLLCSLIVLAMSLENSLAITPAGAGTGGGGSGVSLTSASSSQAQVALVKHGQLDRADAALAPATTAQPASPAGTSTTTWAVIAVVLAALLIGVWALLRRRSGPELAPSDAAFCTLHSEDARCRAT